MRSVAASLSRSRSAALHASEFGTRESCRVKPIAATIFGGGWSRDILAKWTVSRGHPRDECNDHVHMHLCAAPICWLAQRLRRSESNEIVTSPHQRWNGGTSSGIGSTVGHREAVMTCRASIRPSAEKSATPVLLHPAKGRVQTGGGLDQP